MLESFSVVFAIQAPTHTHRRCFWYCLILRTNLFLSWIRNQHRYLLRSSYPALQADAEQTVDLNNWQKLLRWSVSFLFKFRPLSVFQNIRHITLQWNVSDIIFRLNFLKMFTGNNYNNWIVAQKSMLAKGWERRYRLCSWSQAWSDWIYATVS